MKRTVAVGERCIGEGNNCFIIAEAGVNHNGDLDRAFALVDAAKNAGADAVKFQLFNVEEQLSKVAFTAKYQRKSGSGCISMKELAKSYELDWARQKDISQYCAQVGILYMASCFDSRAIDFLMEIGGNCIKIASGEITNFPLLAYASNTGLPILLSTGMSSIQDVANAMDCINSNGNSEVALFQCVSSYPAAPETVNLLSMVNMGKIFGVPFGFSDHTEGTCVASAAVALGAGMVEKHFTVDKTLPGPDHSMSLNPAELKEFVLAIRSVEAALGTGIKKVVQEESETSKVSRRSLVAGCNIDEGDIVGDSNIAFKRPGTGLQPSELKYIRGRKFKTKVQADDLITWDMIE